VYTEKIQELVLLRTLISKGESTNRKFPLFYPVISVFSVIQQFFWDNQHAIMITSRRLLWSVVALSMLAAGQVRAGDDFPSKPIRIIVPFPAGSSADTRTRQLGALMSPRLKQPVIIENRPGAAGTLGTAFAAKSAPDGYTLTYIVTTTVALAPHVYKTVGFDPLKDLHVLIVALKASAILVVRPDSPITSLQDLMTRAKATPGRLTYGTSGPGSPQHMMGERFKRTAQIDLVPVHYKGDAPTLTDLMGGHVDMTFGFGLATLPLIQSGKLRPLAVASGRRMSVLPQVPTMAESGVANYDEFIWAGYAAPAGIAPERARKLHQALQDAMLSEEFKTGVVQSGAELIASTQEYAQRQLREDHARYGIVVRELALRAE
jgi:tripartite-type tricarboxylate transporter receptor subunit TctC